MSECMQIHETVVKDIVDVISGIKDFDGVEWLRKRNNTGSIAKRAANLTIVFPCIVSSNNSIENCMLAVKALEKKYVMLLEILFASVQITDADNMYDYMKQFHTNLNSKMSLDDFMSFMDKMEEGGKITVTDRDAYEAIREDMKHIGFEINRSFNKTSLNDYAVSKTMMGESSIYLETRSINESIPRTPSGTIEKNDIEYMKFRGNNMTPMDVKKANELMPTLMHINFITQRDGETPIAINDAIVGVKVKMYPIDSIEITNRLTSKVKDKNGLFNLIRATTREISFFRDLAFAIDKAKLDAIQVGSNSDNAKMFRLLERRAAKNKFMSLIKKNDASPITSLILSQEDVEYMMKYHSLDVRKAYIARTIMESYNLMNITILDESLEIARFLFDDGDGLFETLTFDALEKEAGDNSYKKVINLMSKMTR